MNEDMILCKIPVMLPAAEVAGIRVWLRDSLEEGGMYGTARMLGISWKGVLEMMKEFCVCLTRRGYLFVEEKAEGEECFP